MSSGYRFFITLFIIITLSFSSYAQYKRKAAFWEGFTVAPMVGVNMFYGDLVDNSRTSYSGGAVAEREINTYLSYRFQLMGGKMKGEQTVQDVVSADFKNMYIDASAGVSFKPLNLLLGYYKQRSLNPYIFTQVGIIYYNATEAFHSGYPVPNRPDRQTSGISPIISIGPGVSYWLTPRLSIKAELNGTYVFGDEVDGHKEWEELSGIIHQTASNDYYYTITAGVSYLISDSKWKNSPKYNRKAYLKTRTSYRKGGSKKYKSPKRRKRR